ncbi:TadG family pilus assembly protein [Paraburkholderia sp. SIMBA_030]|uniref:TadG family pilus assembly protein n=1 Tax=Paraburkholderia sp. SIMBA_030 TaxID=3085773 RepID=UPI00397E9011
MSVAMLSTLFAALLVAAFSIDIGHGVLARSELQSAADAAALAGAGALLPGSPGPNWSLAQTNAAKAVSLNSSDSVTLTSASVQSGFWNLTGSPAGMQASTISPGTYDNPAVKVTVSRAAGLNNGPVRFFFAPLFGVDNGAVTATAVAVVSAPGYVAAGGLFPVAIGKCIFDQYWNAQTGSPKLDPSTGQAYTFQFGNGSLYGGCAAGQWTSFQLNTNDVPSVRGLIDNKNPTALGIGDSIWIQNGVKTTIYSSVPSNVDVLIPVVQTVPTSGSSSTAPIVGFAAFHIDSGNGGNGKYIQGHLTAGVKIATSTGKSGPYYGAYVPPRLAE